MSSEMGLAKGRWRSLAEATGKFDPDASREFPVGVDEVDPTLRRREVLQLLGASVLLAGTAGCARAPRGKIVPYSIQPPEVTPGLAKHYATAMSLDGYATGLLVESHEGRPTKVEGNPDHPASLGATGLLEQASILSLYDPARASGVFLKGQPKSWRRFVEALTGGRDRPPRLDGTHFLLEPTSSPFTGHLIEQLRARGAAFHFYAPVSRNAVWEGSRLAFGRPLDPVFDLERADVIVALDSDLLAAGPFHCRYARKFADGRRVRSRTDAMNRLYVAEPILSVTGATADHRLRVKAREIGAVAAGILRELSEMLKGAPWLESLGGSLAPWHEPAEGAAWVRAVARDLLAHSGRSLVVVGEGQPSSVHAIAALLNHALGNVGSTVRYTKPVVLEAGTAAHTLEPLLDELDADRVLSLVILGGNPSYTAPRDVELSRRIKKAKTTAYLGTYANETAKACEWLIPLAHYLESWGDTRALDGTLSLVQPLIEPLFGGRSVTEVLALFVGENVLSDHDALLAYCKDANPDLHARWLPTLQRGVAEGTAAPSEIVEPRTTELAARLGKPPGPSSASSAPRPLELVVRADSKVHDGTFANNAWLQELPDSMTKLTWGNAALVSPATAARLDLATEDVVRLSLRGESVETPVFVMPGQADDSIALMLGYGREGDEELGHVGVNAYRLRTTSGLSFDSDLKLEKTGRTRLLASTQEHWSTENRPVALRADLLDYGKPASDVVAGQSAPRQTLYQLSLKGQNQWAMSIDLNACTGCNVCVIACQAENNIPIVGEAGVRKNREMHWIRVDRYFSGELADPVVDVEPMACQHCEKAPCEYVCPVGATVHSPDGLNEMVYNRCVGTRFCSNNCPYKVRRFNWFDYNADKTEPQKMVMNPDVTVRARGVMEKCSYCVQRIRESEIGARIAGKPMADGGVVTACQQACPSKAIVFGSLSDPTSEVAKLHANSRTYNVLDELGTAPRTRYMVRLRNPNPELKT
jgi:Fe-S-cluster-containing dehydrogenase component/anaerobic selenocysteine-containing dehydrogenase